MSSVSPPRTLNGFELETFEDDLLTYENEDLTARIRFNGPAWLVELGEIRVTGDGDQLDGRILTVTETADDGIEFLRDVTDAPLTELRQRSRGMGDFAPTLNISRETGGNITGRQQAVLEETFRSTDEIAALTNDQLLTLPRIGQKTVETIRREFGGVNQAEEFDPEDPDEIEGEDMTAISGIGESFAMDIAEQTGIQTAEELRDTLWRNPGSVTSVPRIQWGTVIEDALDPVSRSAEEFGLREDWEVWGLYFVRRNWDDGGPSLEEIKDLDMFENGYVNAANTVSVVGPDMDPTPDVERGRFSISPDFALHTETVVPQSSDITDNESIIVFDSPEAQFHSTIGYDLLETAQTALGYDPIDRKQLWRMAEESDFPILLDDSGGRFSVFVAPRILAADSTTRDSFVDELEQNARDVIDDVGLPGRDLIPTMRSRVVVGEPDDAANFASPFYTTEGNLVPFSVKQEVVEEAEEQFGSVLEAGFDPGTIVGSFAFKGRELLDTSFDPRDPPSGAEDDDVLTVVSQFRPLPRSARKELEEFGIIDTREVNEPGRMEEVDLEERPPDELLERFELAVDPGEPIETWVTDRGEEVRIFADRVISDEDGEMGIEPEEAAKEVREQDRFEPVMVPADSPLVDDDEDEDAEEEDEDSDTVALPDRVDEGRWDVAVVVRPDNDFRERYEARLFPDSVRKNPGVEVGEETIEEMEDDAQGIPAWQYDDGDVVAVYAVRDGARGGVRIQAQSYSPGVDLLRERTTDDSGNLTVTSSDGWVGIHPESLLDADVGDLSAGWVTAPIKANDSRSTFHVGWEGERAYHYRELREPPYFVYEFDREAGGPDFDDTLGPGGGNPPTKRWAAVYRTPANDEVIGLEPRSDEGPKPGTPIFASEFEAEYDLNPTITSGDDVSEIIEKDILIRTSGGFLHETTATTETVSGTGFRVPDRVSPDGVWYVPTSSKSDDNTIELVGVRDDSFAVESLPDDLLNATVTGESEASVALVQEMFPVLSDAQARDFAGIIPGSSVEEVLEAINVGSLTGSVGGIGPATVNKMLGTDDWEANQTLLEALERDISEGVSDEIIQAARDFEPVVPGEVVVSQDGQRYVLDIDADVSQERVEELQNNAEAVVGPASAFSPGQVVGEFDYDRPLDTVSDLEPTVDPRTDEEDGFSGLITVAVEPGADEYTTEPQRDATPLVSEFVDDVMAEFGQPTVFRTSGLRRPRAVAIATVEDGEMVERDFTGGVDILEGRNIRDAEQSTTTTGTVSAEPPERGEGLTAAEVRRVVDESTQGVTVDVEEALGRVVGITLRSTGEVGLSEGEIRVAGFGGGEELAQRAIGRWAVSVDSGAVDRRVINDRRESLEAEFGISLPAVDVGPAEAGGGGETDDDQERVIDEDAGSEEERELFRLIEEGLRAANFPVSDPPGSVRFDAREGRFSIRRVMDSEWERVMSSEPFGTFSQSAGVSDEEFVFDYLDHLRLGLEPERREAVDMPAAAEFLGVEMEGEPVEPDDEDTDEVTNEVLDTLQALEDKITDLETQVEEAQTTDMERAAEFMEDAPSEFNAFVERAANPDPDAEPTSVNEEVESLLALFGRFDGTAGVVSRATEEFARPGRSDIPREDLTLGIPEVNESLEVLIDSGVFAEVGDGSEVAPVYRLGSMREAVNQFLGVR